MNQHDGGAGRQAAQSAMTPLQRYLAMQKSNIIGPDVKAWARNGLSELQSAAEINKEVVETGPLPTVFGITQGDITREHGEAERMHEQSRQSQEPERPDLMHE